MIGRWLLGIGERDVKVVVRNGKGEKGNKAEGGVVAKGGAKGGGCGGPKFVETEADNAGRERGRHVCDVCTGIYFLF